MKSVRAGIIAAISVLVLSGPAAAGTKDDVRALQAQMAEVQQAMAGHRAALVRISELERQNQLLTGRVEELTYELEQATRRLDAITAALSGDANAAGVAAFSDFDSAPSSSGPMDLMGRPSSADDPIADQISEQTAEPAGAAPSDVSLPLDPNAAFDYASGFILSGDYQRAKAAFSLYVEAFPNHQRTPDAQFRLGEIHLALEENAAAADAFIQHIRKYPDNGRSAEAYLKLGTAFARLDKPSEACTVFKTMKAKHPNAPDAVMQRADLEMARIECN
ncbi:tetratricopeptide repeat protein [Hyphococcus flavus]|uniref:Cell division coordinator CpoB n=1 Tax=Hyphococcus flavus TaxID=1866326 RepID=A0AAE9ZKP5_9PROT|nr:tetratricopeptide repeat protein [Hyphococcus flavus]WDI32385.1 tetratricopeptide repeat protein [Hyphococcus flavus]